MTGDHLNKVMHLDMPWLTDVARVVFPIFAIVLTYNVVTHAHPAAQGRAFKRTLIAACVAQPLHAWAFGYLIPLNVLFTLAAGLYVVTTSYRSRAIAIAILAGFFVDYAWPGIAVMAATAWHLRNPTRREPILAMVAAVASLWLINGNGYALLALPLVTWFGPVDVTIPRQRWAFLGYYVGHLALLAANA